MIDEKYCKNCNFRDWRKDKGERERYCNYKDAYLRQLPYCPLSGEGRIEYEKLK